MMAGESTALLDRERLAKILGLLGSDHAGERASAAAAADRLVREAGLRWPDVLSPPTAVQRPPATPQRRKREIDSVEDAIAFVRDFEDVLTPWERKFAASVARQSYPVTQKQLAVLRRLVDKARLAEGGWR